MIKCSGLKHRGYHIILKSGQFKNTAFNLLGSTYDSPLLRYTLVEESTCDWPSTNPQRCGVGFYRCTMHMVFFCQRLFQLE